MVKERSVALWGSVSVGVTIAAYLLLQLLLACLVVNGTLTEGEASGLQILGGGIAAVFGGVWALRMSGWKWSPAVSALCAVVIIVAAGFAGYGAVEASVETFLRILVILGGGVVVSVMVSKKARKSGKRLRRKTVR